MRLRYKFALPINLILVLVLGASLAWEWRRLEVTGLAVLRARLDEEARFLQAAYRTMGVTPRFAAFLTSFCHATDAVVSPAHQVAVVDRDGDVMKSACVHGGRPLDPARLAARGEGSWVQREDDDSYLVRVADDGTRRVVVAESTRALRDRVRSSLLDHATWYLGLGVAVLAASNVLMRRAVLRPIRRLFRAVRQLEQGRLGVEVDGLNGDELGALGRRFNAMSRALAERAEAERRELETARRVQAHLLPPPELRLGPLEVAGRCRQRGPVGGDLYDVQPLSGDRVAVLVADLAGHNVAAALHTAMLRAIVWREAEQARSPAEVLNRLNERLCRDLPDEHFATAFFGWFERGSGRLHYANAGHPPAYIRCAAGTVRELGATGPLLGILPEATYEDAAVEVEPGSHLLVYTDGLTETEGAHGGMWGTEELLALLRTDGAAPPGGVVDRILERVAAFRREGPQHDDVTVVLAGYRPG